MKADVTSNSAEERFALWAPDDSLWSPWAKPVAFLHAGDIQSGDGGTGSSAVPAAVTSNASVAIVVDLPGAEAVHMGLALAEHGFRPVPLFNGTSGPAAVIDVGLLTRALLTGARVLEGCRLAPDAPPAFLLDSRRNEPRTGPAPGAYDNRWVALPQDFPSGALLASRGIRLATVIRSGGTLIRPDLAHVLRRWQEHGVRTRVIDLGSQAVTDYQDVPKPSLFRVVWYAAVTLLGLRRSNVGGFGSSIPDQSQGGRFA